MPLTIRRENLTDAAITAVAGFGEPSHVCVACDVPLWALDDRDIYRECPQCGEEASPIRYCGECDAPNCNYHNHR